MHTRVNTKSQQPVDMGQLPRQLAKHIRLRYTMFVSVNEILQAIRGLPRPERLRLVAELELELAQEGAGQTVTADDPLLEERGRLLVYTGPVDVKALDHRAAREERIEQLMARSLLAQPPERRGALTP